MILFALFAVALVLAVIYCIVSVKILRPNERGVVERFGQVNRFAEPGMHFVPALIERLIVDHVSERLMEARPQQIITKDKVNVTVDAQVYFRIRPDQRSFYAAMYNVDNVAHQMNEIARTSLRNIIGGLALAEANTSRDKINGELMSILRTETANWGVDIVRTEIKEIEPSKNVLAAMEEVVNAESRKIAASNKAEAVFIEAQGARKAAVEVANGEKEAAVLYAAGRAESIKLVNEAAEKYFTGNAVKLKELEVTQASLQENTKFVLTEKGMSPTVVLGETAVIGGKKQ